MHNEPGSLNVSPMVPICKRMNQWIVNEAQAVLCFSLLLFVLFLSGSARPSSAQTPTPTPSEEEIKLQEEKRLLELKRDIELAKKAIRDAQPAEAPTPAVTPLAGDTTLSEGVRLETEMVSYKAMSQVAAEISRELKTKLQSDSAPTIAIYDAQVIKDWRFYQALLPAFGRQVEDMILNYKDALCDNPFADPKFKDSALCTNEDESHFSRQKVGTVADRSVKSILNAIPGAFGAGAGLLKSFIDFAALFRTDTKVEGKAVTIDQTALVAEVFRALRNDFSCQSRSYGIDPDLPGRLGDTVTCQSKNLTLYYPGVFPPRKDSIQAESSTVAKIGLLYLYKEQADKIIKKLNELKQQKLNSIQPALAQRSEYQAQLKPVEELTEKRDNLTKAIANEPIAVFRRKLWDQLREVLAELAKFKYSKSELEALIKTLDDGTINPVKKEIKAIDENQIKPLADMNDRFQSFVDQFVKVEEGKGINTLALFVKSEDIENIMNSAESYWLEIKSVSAGGNNRTRKNLIWFFAGARLDHSGGAIIEYTLFNKTGAVVYSDKRSYYEGYIEPKNIRKGKLRDTVRP